MMEMMNINDEVLLCGNATFFNPQTAVVSFASVAFVNEENFSSRAALREEKLLKKIIYESVMSEKQFQPFLLAPPFILKCKTFKRHCRLFTARKNFPSRTYYSIKKILLIISIKRYFALKRLNGIHCDYNDFSFFIHFLRLSSAMLLLQMIILKIKIQPSWNLLAVFVIQFVIF